MPPPPERSRGRLVGRALGVALIALAVMPAYLTLAASWRPIVLRLACGALVIAGSLRAVRWLRERIGPPAGSPFEAPAPPPPVLILDARFTGLREDLVSSARSQRYFDVILWPKLAGLAGGDLPRPEGRRGLLGRRGPSLAVLERLVAEVERRG